MRVLLCFLLFCFVASARAQVGVSAFAIMNPSFPCATFLKLFSGSRVAFISVLAGTFGEDMSCLKKFLKLPQRKIVQVHLTNEAGRRNVRLFPGDFAPLLSLAEYDRRWAYPSPLLKSKYAFVASYFANFAAKHPSTEWIITEGLESNGSVRAARNRVRAIKEVAPYDIAYAPLRLPSNWRAVNADYIEQHGDKPRIPREARCIANLDGTDIDFGDGRGATDNAILLANVRRYIGRYRHRCKTLLWWSSLQGTRGGFRPPRERSFKLYNSQIKAVNKLLRRYNENG